MAARLLALALLLALGGLAARAQEGATAEDATAPVSVGGRRLFDVTASGGASAAQRAVRINRRLQQLVVRDADVPPFIPTDVQTRNGEHVIALGGVHIMTVTSSDVDDAATEPRELALLWAGEMSRAVADARAARENALAGLGILVRNSFQDLIASIAKWLPRAAGALLLLLIFWVLARLARWLMHTAAERLDADPHVRGVLRAITSYGVWTIGALAILSALGIDSASIAAAVGVSGFILGFAFKDILSHFLAGLFLLVGGKFRVGDQIVVREFEGTVERIEMRAIHLRTYDNRLVVIPNGDVFTSVVTSNTASPQRRRAFTVGIGYNDDIGKAQEVAIEAVRATPGVLAEPPPDVLVDELALSTVNLRVRFWVNSLRADYVRVGSACMWAVKEAFNREGISMPTDIRTIVIQDLDVRLGHLETVLTEAARNSRPVSPEAASHIPQPSPQEPEGEQT